VIALYDSMIKDAVNMSNKLEAENLKTQITCQLLYLKFTEEYD